MKSHYTEIDGKKIMSFYDRHLRLWTAFIIDDEENQIAPAVHDISKHLVIQAATYQEDFVHAE